MRQVSGHRQWLSHQQVYQQLPAAPWSLQQRALMLPSQVVWYGTIWELSKLKPGNNLGTNPSGIATFVTTQLDS